MAWTLEHDGVVQTLKDWRLEGVGLTQTHAQTGRLTATARGEMMHPVPWASTGTVILRKDGESKWRGVAMSARCTGQGSNKRVAVTFCGPWCWLDQGTHRQQVLDAVFHDAVRLVLVALLAGIFLWLGWPHIGVGAAVSTLQWTLLSAATERPYDVADGKQVARDPHPRLALPGRGVVIDHVTTIFCQQAVVHDAAGCTAVADSLTF